MSAYAVAAAPGMSSQTRSGASIIQNKDACLPLSRSIRETDVILLLTPGIPPEYAGNASEPRFTSDPFEPLGRALAKYCPRIRHVPYVPRNGITGTHVVHIERATNVIFVISGPSRAGQPSQVGLAEVVRNLCDERPHIVVVCCSTNELGPIETAFPTIVQLPGYSASELESAADLIFRDPPAQPQQQQQKQREGNLSPPGSSSSVRAPASALSPSPSIGPNLQNLILAPRSWTVDMWDASRDPRPLPAIEDLWRQSLPDKFRLTGYALQRLLRRDGYGMHYLVREPGTGQLLGFCATYTTYADSGGERLIGSIAVLLVRPEYRGRGIGFSLHDHATRQLARTRGVFRLQLGSTFPRLLYGLPVDSPAEDWFRRRGWPMDRRAPGTGQEASDWILRIEDLPAMGLTASSSCGLTFRRCSLMGGEFEMVLELVARELQGKDHMGWYDQYAKLANTMNVTDIVLGLDGRNVVATALTYARNTGSPVAEDLPWAGTIGDDVGGVTCICIIENNPVVARMRDTIMIRLLDFCTRVLAEQGMRKMMIDAVKGGDEGFLSIGFQKWARYRDIWRDV